MIVNKYYSASSSVIRSHFGSLSLLSQKRDFTINYNDKSQKRYLSLSRESSEGNSDDTEAKRENYDIIINGGGIVGFALLAALQSSKFLRERKILLCEQQPKTNVKSDKTQVQGERQLSNRVSSLTCASKRFFREIGIWDEMKDLAKPIKSMHVWAHLFHEGITFKPSKNNAFFNDDSYLSDDENVICYVTENNVIMRSLRSVIDDMGHNVCYNTGITDVIGDGNCVSVTSKCSSNNYTNEMKTSLLVGCDGFNSLVRQKSNLKVFEHDLEQCGIVGTVTISPDNENVCNEIAWQRFVPYDNSVIALLPLTKEHCSFVISTSVQRADELMKMSDDQFVDEMNESLSIETSHDPSSFANTCDKLINSLLPIGMFAHQRPRFSPPRVISIDPQSRASFPLKFSTTLPYLIGSPRGSNTNKIAIIGDAAHRVHPLAGQGLNLGLGDAHVLVKCLDNAMARGENLFGDDQFEPLEKCLYNFERERQIKLVPMMAAIHSMQQLFSFVPSRALTAFNSLDIVKEQIVSFANTN